MNNLYKNVRTKTVDWKSFAVPEAFVTLALAAHEELVKAAMAILPTPMVVEHPSVSCAGYDGILFRQVKNIRDTEICGLDRRRIQVTTMIPDPVIRGEQPLDYGIWIDLKARLRHETVLDACASARDAIDWYMVEECTVVGAGIVKDMSVFGAPTLDQLVREMEAAKLEDERYLVFTGSSVDPAPPLASLQEVMERMRPQA